MSNNQNNDFFLINEQINQLNTIDDDFNEYDEKDINNSLINIKKIIDNLKYKNQLNYSTLVDTYDTIMDDDKINNIVKKFSSTPQLPSIEYINQIASEVVKNINEPSKIKSIVSSSTGGQITDQEYEKLFNMGIKLAVAKQLLSKTSKTTQEEQTINDAVKPYASLLPKIGGHSSKHLVSIQI